MTISAASLRTSWGIGWKTGNSPGMSGYSKTLSKACAMITPAATSRCEREPERSISMANQLTAALYRPVRGLVRLVYPKTEVVGAEKLPEGAAVVVGNHSQLHGPIACELYFPGRHATWCAGEMTSVVFFFSSSSFFCSVTAFF